MTKSKKVKKEKQPPEPFFKELVSIWFNFTKNRYGDIPSFDGSAPRDLKQIITQLRKRCEAKSIVWDEIEAKKRLQLFLMGAYDIQWLKEHWTLFNINRQKDIIFLNAAKNALHG